MNPMRLPLGAFAMALLLLAGCRQQADAPESPAAAPVADVPTPAPVPVETRPPVAEGERPALRVTTLDGAAWDLAGQRGKWVAVNYWATWCKPCIEEMPELSALAAMRQHISVIGLAYDEAAPEELRAFLGKHPVVYPVARIDIYDPPPDLGAPRGLPTTWLIAPDGTLARKYTGPLTARMLEQDIAALGGPAAGAGAPASGAAGPRRE